MEQLHLCHTKTEEKTTMQLHFSTKTIFNDEYKIISTNRRNNVR